jgi:cupin superfamily acireductone dioxygenase involved in methionine salvage
MVKKKEKIMLPKSIRKYIRKEKARIRREVLNIEEQDQKIKQLLERFYENHSQ